MSFLTILKMGTHPLYARRSVKNPSCYLRVWSEWGTYFPNCEERHHFWTVQHLNWKTFEYQLLTPKTKKVRAWYIFPQNRVLSDDVCHSAPPPYQNQWAIWHTGLHVDYTKLRSSHHTEPGNTRRHDRTSGFDFLHWIPKDDNRAITKFLHKQFHETR